MRVVIDTNVVVSGLFFGGTPRAILDFIETEDVVPCFLPSTLQELEAVLQRKKFSFQRSLLSFSIEEFIAALRCSGLVFAEPARHPNIIKEDASDNKFLSCAVASGASCIISGDKHLLALKNFRGIPVVTPAQFLQQIERHA